MLMGQQNTTRNRFKKKKKKKKTGIETVQKHTQKPLNTGHSIVYWYNIVYYLILYVMLIS